MRQTLKRFIKLTAGYSPVTLLGPLLTIFLTPLYTRVLEPADYGVVEVALTLGSFITLFAILGVDQALSAHFFDGDINQRRNLITSSLVFVGVVGLVLGGGLAAIARPLSKLLYQDALHSHLIYLLAINAVSVPIYSVAGAALRLQMDIKRVNALGMFYLLATLVNNVVLILIFRLGATGIVMANVLTNLLAASLGLILLFNSSYGIFSHRLLTPLVYTGLGLLPMSIGGLLLASSDRLLLTQYVSQHDLGLYSIANKLGSMMYVLFGAAWSAWWPLALEMAATPDSPRQYARMFEYFLTASTLISLTIGLFAAEILAVFTREAYVPAAPYVLALLIYFGPTSAMSGFFQLGFFIKKRTYLISIFFLISATINIGLNLFLNPFLGVWGAVWATVFAGGILIFMFFLQGQHIFPVPYHLPRFFALTGTYLGLVVFFLLWPGLNTLIFKIAALSLLFAVVFLVRVISPGQIQIGLDLIRYHLFQLVRVR